jgi:hypothetical protein
MKKEDCKKILLRKHESFLKNAIERQSFSSFITSEFKKDLIDVRKKKKAKLKKV